MNFSMQLEKLSSDSARDTIATSAAFFKSGNELYAYMLSSSCPSSRAEFTQSFSRTRFRRCNWLICLAEGLSRGSGCMHLCTNSRISSDTNCKRILLMTYSPHSFIFGGWPVSIMCKMQPIEKMSAFSSYGWFRATSGAMKPSVPTRLVSLCFALQTADTPKSANFRMRFEAHLFGAADAPDVAAAQRKLPGFRSRCTMPCECKYITLLTTC
mmetsp:Transcript_104576/g.320359  ORF Transcript_104576/g.320359 Transcript_104576/m.320359 type:complete len:212 (+) Transcript_104576:125-760(+)